MSKDLGLVPRWACSFLLSLCHLIEVFNNTDNRGSSAGEAVFMACSLGLISLHLSKLRCVSKLPVGVIELDCSVSEISVRNSLNYYEEGGMLTISTVT